MGQQKQEQGASELSVLGTMLLGVPRHVRVVDVEKNRLPGDTADTPIARTMLLAALCIQSFPFALLKVLILGTIQWGKRIKKNPGNNKNKSDNAAPKQKQIAARAHPGM